MGLLLRLLGLSKEDGNGHSDNRANTSSKQTGNRPFFVEASSATSYRFTDWSHDRKTAAEPSGKDTDDHDEDIICAPPATPVSSTCSSNRRRRTAIDISPVAVQRLASKVAILESSHFRASLSGSGSVTPAELAALYGDMQLIHRGRSSMVYRAREVHSGRRIVIKAYPAAQMTTYKRSNLDRHIRALKGAMGLLGPQGGIVALERVLENVDGTFLVMQACNGGTLIEAVANAGGKLPERQVAVKVALPVLTALADLHSNGIVHRDIKPEHLMIHNGSLKLGDFGSAACMTAAAAHIATATLMGCNSPESHKQEFQQPQPQLQSQVDPSLLSQQQHKLQVQGQNLLEQSLPGQPTAFLLNGGGRELLSNDGSQTHSSRAVPVSATEGAGEAAHGCCDSTSGSALPDSMNSRTGSMEYMAPEMLNKPTAAEVFHTVVAQGIDEDELPCYDAKVDIWSLGVVLYEALTGIQPFLADSVADMAVNISHKLNTVGHAEQKNWVLGDHQQQQQQQQHKQQQQSCCAGWQHGMWSVDPVSLPLLIQQLPVSREGQSFIAACLTQDPARRPTAQQLLQHPWLLAMQANAAAAAAAVRQSLGSCNNSSRSSQAPHSSAGVAAPPGASSPRVHGTNTQQGTLQQTQLRAPPAAAVALPPAAGLAAGRAESHAQQMLDEQHMLMPAGSYKAQAFLEDSSATDADCFQTMPLMRTQTSANFEVGVQAVLRTNTQRMQSKSRLHRVHAP